MHSFCLCVFTANAGWIIAWLAEEVVGSLILAVTLAVTLVICLITASRGLLNSGPYLEENGLKADIWCTRILVQNGQWPF